MLLAAEMGGKDVRKMGDSLDLRGRLERSLSDACSTRKPASQKKLLQKVKDKDEGVMSLWRTAQMLSRCRWTV